MRMLYRQLTLRSYLFAVGALTLCSACGHAPAAPAEAPTTEAPEAEAAPQDAPTHEDATVALADLLHFLENSCEEEMGSDYEWDCAVTRYGFREGGGTLSNGVRVDLMDVMEEESAMGWQFSSVYIVFRHDYLRGLETFGRRIAGPYDRGHGREERVVWSFGALRIAGDTVSVSFTEEEVAPSCTGDPNCADEGNVERHSTEHRAVCTPHLAEGGGGCGHPILGCYECVIEER